MLAELLLFHALACRKARGNTKKEEEQEEEPPNKEEDAKEESSDDSDENKAGKDEPDSDLRDVRYAFETLCWVVHLRLVFRPTLNDFQHSFASGFKCVPF